MHRWPAVAVLVLTLTGASRADLVSLTWHTREPHAGGKRYGDVGPYEKLAGVARFEIDPGHKRNALIIDLGLAARNVRGRVEFAADVVILKPVDVTKGNGALLYDVNNRGNKLALGMFNTGGDDFLFRRGYTLVWSGWIGELLAGNDRLLLQPPVATQNGKPITGLVRFEMTADKAAETMPLSRRDGHGSYAPTEQGEREGVLTWRMRETDERVIIPREQWSLVRPPAAKVKAGVPATLAEHRLRVAGGFRPGALYELICEARDPIVQGTGFAGVRDLVSFLKYDHSERNPLRGAKTSAITRAHGFGVSQSGRFLRHFVYQAFNADEKDRRVFDGLIPHVAGGGLGFFNHRFAQPTRHNTQHDDHLYHADVFPFTYGDSDDDFPLLDGTLRRRGTPDGICKRLASEDARLLPKILHTQSAAEYWHRSGSLVHTDTRGTADAVLPENVRVYAFGGTQHGPAGTPPARGIADNLHNPGDYRPFLRALLDALDAWVRDGTPPPPSVYPRIDAGMLVDWRQKATGFPALPGVRYPEVIQQPSARQFDVEPPRILGHYRVLVPKADAAGNDLGTLLPLEVRVPLATYTGWNLRRAEVGAEGMLASLLGSYFPFPRTEGDRVKTGDPRPSIEKRYGSFEAYAKRHRDASAELVKARYLLDEDAKRLDAKLAEAKGLFTPAK